MQLLLLFVVIFGGVNLERLDYDVVLLWLDYLEDLERLLAMSIAVLQLRLAELAMEGLPDVGGHMHTDLLVLVTTQPLPQALQVHVRHGPTALAGRN